MNDRNSRDPYNPTLYCIGFQGVGEYRAKEEGKMTKVYTRWYNMLKRCYCENYRKKFPTYSDCSVCKEWHDFQIFAKWFTQNYIEGFDLDKDLLIKGNKIYSPSTCCFIPKEINYLLIKGKSRRGNYPIGVTCQNNRFIAQLRTTTKGHIYLGSFDTFEEAYNIYKLTKESYIKELADLWKPKLTEPSYIALYNYKVEISD